MSTFFQFLAGQGGVLLAAATCLLAMGCVGVALQRSPIHRQRAGEVAILGVLIWLFLACVPLPRYRLPALWPADRVVESSVRPAEPAAIPPPVLDAQDEAVLAEVMVEEEVPLMRSDVSQPDMHTAAEGGGATVPVLSDLPDPATVVEAEMLSSRGVVPHTADEDRATATLGRSASVAPAFDVRYPLAIAYVAGALGCLVWLALGRVLLLRMLWSARPPEPWLREVYHWLPFGRRKRPRLLISDRCTRALSFGIWRPAIVLPGDACRTDRLEALRYVLSHELAHVRQRDGWGHLLFNAAFPLLYFHPLYWWLRSRAYLAAELIADDLAAGRRTKEAYVEALVALAKRGGRVQLAYSSSPQVFGSRSQFYRRMQMLLDRETRLARRPSPLWRVIYPPVCLLAVVLVAGAAGVRPAEAQSEEVLPPAEPAAEAFPAAESVAEPLLAAEPAVEPGVPSAAQAVEARLSEPGPVSEGMAQLRKERDILLAQRAELQKELKDLVAAVRSLKGELEVLRVSPRSSQQGREVAGRVRRLAADLESVALKAHRGVSRPRAGIPEIAPRDTPATAQAAPLKTYGPIPKGYRVVTLNVDVDSARKFKPGDFVNVATWKSNIPDVMVFAVPGEPAADGRRDSSGRSRVTVSLLVTPAEAKKLAQVSGERGISLQDPKRLLQTTRALVMTSKPAEPRQEALKPKPPPSLPALPSPTAQTSKSTSTGRRTDLFGAIAERRAPQGTRLDLVRLATSYADVVGELEIAKLEVESRKELAQRKAISRQELAIAEIRFKTADRKVAVLRRIARSAIVATQAETDAAKTRLAWVKKNRPNDDPDLEATKSQMIGAESRLEILQSILD